MPSVPRSALSLVILVGLLLTGCAGDRSVEVPASPEEQVLLAQLTRDKFVEVIERERNDLEQLVVTTRQGSQRVRYVFKPARPGDAELMIHKINDRSVLEIEESDQLGTGPQIGTNGRYR